jgi:uncharacterized protein YqgC (DUF456 family)
MRIGVAAGIPALLIGSVAMLLYRQTLPCPSCFPMHPERKLLPMLSLAAFVPLAALSGYLAASGKRLPAQAARAGLVVGCFSAASGLILVPPISVGLCPACLQINVWALHHPLLWSVLTFLSVPPSVFWFISRVALGLLLAEAAGSLRRFSGPGLRAIRPAGST